MSDNLQQQVQESLKALGIGKENKGVSTGNEWLEGKGERYVVTSPTDGQEIGSVRGADEAQYKAVVMKSKAAFEVWRAMPAPKRGEIIRQIGNKLREYKHHLGLLVSYEMGKIYEEGLGEVQEMIDIADFAVGLSRQLYGLTMHSERPHHRMYEQWHPLGTVGIISAFNFPVAVYSWNAFVAAVCGDVCIWKPSEKTPLTGVATQRIVAEVLKENNLPEGIFNLVVGGREIGQGMAKDPNINLVSATGSVAMGRSVAKTVGERLGKMLLELGGNNAIIVSNKADMAMALKGVVFGAAGTAGQRCTTTRRIFLHEDIYDRFRDSLVDVFKQLRIGHPLKKETLVGPLIDQDSVQQFQRAQEKLQEHGGKIIYGGNVLEGEEYASGCYVTPCVAEVSPDNPMVQEETFAPLVYLMKYRELDNAIGDQNAVPQGLSSAIFTMDLREAERFLSFRGSDCGIANVNIGTSGAEIGGAFGGEKDTGGGRESGSDAWKAYMRRQTSTINWGEDLPLAQGIEFMI